MSCLRTSRLTYLRPAAFAALLLLTASNPVFLRAQTPATDSAASPGAAAASAADDQTASAPTLNIDARLVEIPVLVYDKKGVLLQNLAKESFVLQVDGHPQPIRYFNRDTDLPLTLGLLVDVSQSQRDAIDNERTASFAFLDDMLNVPASRNNASSDKPSNKSDRDKAFIVQFARQTDLLQDTTPSKPKLQAALKQLETPASGPDADNNGPGDSNGRDTDNGRDGNGRGGSNGPGGGNGPGPRPRRASSTLYDAIFLSSDELMSKQTGRKALIVLSDGVDSGSKESLASAIEAAQRANTAVYAIYFKGNENAGQRRGFPGGGPDGGQGGGGQRGGISFPGSGGGGYPGGGGGGRGGRQPDSLPQVDGKKILTRITEETGGRLFEVSKKQTFAEIYQQIAEELRAEYRLGYTPDKDTASDGYHRIIVTLTKFNPKDIYIQTRDGYYSGD